MTVVATDVGGELSDALRPVRDALIGRAEARAARVRAQADAAAAAQLAEARAKADLMVVEAGREGAAQAEAVLSVDRARARREARAVVLAAECSAYDALRRAARAEVRSVFRDPAWAGLPARLESLARERLGAEAAVTRGPGGAVVGETADHRVEWSPDGLADRAVEQLGPEVAALWAR